MIEPSQVDMQDRVCLVTGATAGIGYHTAEGLAAMGARTVLLARNAGKAADAAEKIRQRTGNRQVEVVIADLSRLDDVRRAAVEIGERFDALHVLVNNAGVIAREHTITEDGHELQWAVNHLAPFALTNRLLSLLEASGPARVVTVSSQVHHQGVIDFGDLTAERYYDPLAAYYRSKLANVVFTYALADRLAGTDVTANCLHPGVYATTLLADYSGQPHWQMAFLRLRHHGPEHGAKTSLYLATSPEMDGVSGKYFHNDTGEARSAEASYDRALQQQLWAVSAAACGLD